MVLNETIIDLEKRFTSGVKVDTHPWHGLDESSGIYSLDPTIRKIAERTLALNEQVANVTAIRPINGIEARSWCHAELVRNRLSVGTSMLVSDPLGELMQVATLADRGKNTYAEFDTIGNYDQLLSLELARMRIGAGGLEKLHLQYLEALVGLPENGLLIEVGAGSFYERILALNAIALKRKGHFICHDATPAAVKAARGEVPEIPYWALPPLTQFLGKALTEVASPVVLTSKNVITSMSYERMTDLLAICRDAKAERLVMSLSLQFNASNPSIPHSHRVSQSDISPLLIERIVEQLDRRGIQTVFNAQIDRSIAASQGYMTFFHAISEIVPRDFFARAVNEGIFLDGKGVVVELKKDLDRKAAFEFIEVHPLGTMLSSYEMGLFNTFLTGPFGVSLATQPDVPRGHLRVIQPQVHFVFSKSRQVEPIVIKGGRVISTSLTSREMLTPTLYRYQDLRTFFQLLGVNVQAIPSILSHHREGIRALQQAGAAAGIAHCYDMQSSGNQWFASPCVMNFQDILLRELAN